jgi:hypothetical protein
MSTHKVKVAVCTVTFTKMWLAGTPTRIIAETLKISADKCDVTRRQLALPRRESWHGAKTGKRTAYLPTEDEIRQKCLEIQATWSDEERAKRCVGWSPESEQVEIRVISDSQFQYIDDFDTSGGL